MIFVKLDVSLRDHDKMLRAIRKVGWGALGVYSWALMYLRDHETETGVISDEVVSLSMPNQSDTARIVTALVEANLWVRDEDRGGFYVRNYEAKNETKTVINERRAATSDRVTRYRQTRNALQPSVTNVDVTQQRERESKSQRESKREEEKDTDGAKSPPARTKTKLSEPVAYRLPEDWQPTDTQVESLRKKLQVEPMGSLEDFVGCFVSMNPKNPNSKKTRWDIAFSRWVKKDAADGKLAAWSPPAKQRVADPGTLFTPEKIAENQRKLRDLGAMLAETGE
jgi:hypothetical protein